jgi:two-component system response regulator
MMIGGDTLMTDMGPLVLMADDDDDDCALAKDAFEQSGVRGSIQCVEDGIILMEYLSGSGSLPALILLDLNMPRKDGRQVLREIKLIPELERVPIVVLTTSQEEKDIAFSRQMGAKSFITKPARFSEWVEMMKSLAADWLDA